MHRPRATSVVFVIGGPPGSGWAWPTCPRRGGVDHGSFSLRTPGRGRRASEVLQEILYRYVGLRRPDLAVEVYDLFVGLCSTVFPLTLADTDRARDPVRAGTPASMRDLVQAAVMLNNEVTKIASFDGGFDEVSGIVRRRLE